MWLIVVTGRGEESKTEGKFLTFAAISLSDEQLLRFGAITMKKLLRLLNRRQTKVKGVR